MSDTTDWYVAARRAAIAEYRESTPEAKTGIKSFAGALLRKMPVIHDLMFLRDLRHSSYLATSGWFASRDRGIAVDEAGNPLPWLTYGAIEFLSSRVQPSWSIFEYGCGNSTLWWSTRVLRVVSCEHHPEWAAGFRKQCPSNVHLIQHDLIENGRYARAPSEFKAEFEVVVIDGRDRVNCASHCLCALKDDGIIVWDNSEREKYQPGYEFLAAHGFRQIDFSGLGPVNLRKWNTSIFYRSNNCLGI